MKKTLIFLIALIAIATAQMQATTVGLSLATNTSNSTKSITPIPVIQILPEIPKNYSTVTINHKLPNATSNASTNTSKALNFTHFSQVHVNYNNNISFNNSHRVNTSNGSSLKPKVIVGTMNLSVASSNISLNATSLRPLPSNFTVNKSNSSISKNISRNASNFTVNKTSSSVLKNLSSDVKNFTLNATNFSIKINYTSNPHNTSTYNPKNTFVNKNLSNTSSNYIFNKTSVAFVNNYSGISNNRSNVTTNWTRASVPQIFFNSSTAKPGIVIEFTQGTVIEFTQGTVIELNQGTNITVSTTKNVSNLPHPTFNPTKFAGPVTPNISKSVWKYDPKTKAFVMIYTEQESNESIALYANYSSNKSNSTYNKSNSTYNKSNSTYNKSHAQRSQVYSPRVGRPAYVNPDYQGHSGFHRWSVFLWTFSGVVIAGLIIASCCIFCRKAKRSLRYHHHHHHPHAHPHHHLPPHLDGHHHQHRLSHHKLKRLQRKYGITFGLPPHPVQQAPLAYYNPQVDSSSTQFELQTDPSSQNLAQSQEFYQQENVNNNSFAREVPMTFNPQVAGHYPRYAPQFQPNPMLMQPLPQSHPQYYVYPTQFQQFPHNVTFRSFVPTAQPIATPTQNTTNNIRPPRNKIDLEL